MSSAATPGTTAFVATRTPQATITQFFPRVRLMQYIEQFKKDPMTFLNDKLMRDECEWVPMRSGFILAHKRRDDTEHVTPAEVRIIGEISKSSFWLYPCGGWNGNFDEPIEKAKATGRICPERLPEVEGMWTRFVEVLDDVVFSRGVPMGGRHYPLFERGEFKIRHKIFEPAQLYVPSNIEQIRSDVATVGRPQPTVAFDSADNANVKANASTATTDNTEGHEQQDDPHGFVDVSDEFEMLANRAEGDSENKSPETTDFIREASEPLSNFSDGETMASDVSTVIAESDETHTGYVESDDELPPAFNMRSWPCRSVFIRDRLDALIESGKYVGLPIPVFDMNGERVPPAEYEERLKGALVDVSVKITNITYKQYGFFADIASIVILAPPGYEPTVETAVVKKKLKYPTPSHLKKFVATSSK